MGNEKSSLKIISAQTETTEHELRTYSKHKVIVMKATFDEIQV